MLFKKPLMINGFYLMWIETFRQIKSSPNDWNMFNNILLEVDANYEIKNDYVLIKKNN